MKVTSDIGNYVDVGRNLDKLIFSNNYFPCSVHNKQGNEVRTFASYNNLNPIKWLAFSHIK